MDSGAPTNESTVPTTDYSENWQRYKRLRNLFFFVWLGYVPVAGLALLLLSFPGSSPAREHAIPVPTVTYCELVKAPESFAGKRIRVRAVYKYGFEIQRLDPPQCCPGKPVDIWVELGDLEGRSRRLARAFPKGMGLALGVFAGVFEGPAGYGHLA
jgi:hypothetical protein